MANSKSIALANLPPADELASIRQQIRNLQRRESELRSLLLTDPTVRTGNRFAASIRIGWQSRINRDLLRQDYPDVAAAVMEKVKVQYIRLSAIIDDSPQITLK